MGLGATREGDFGRRLIAAHDLRPVRTTAVRDGRNLAAGDLGLADEGCAFFDHEARRLQIALKRTPRLQLAAFAHGDVAMHFAVNGDRFCLDLAANISVFTDRQNTIGIDLAFDLAVDEQLLLKFDASFDLDIAREDVFARMFGHIFLMLVHS